MSLYDLTVPAYVNALGALSAQLAKAQTWGSDNAVGELQFAAGRLAPDMFPLPTQIRFACGQAVSGLARLGASGGPDFPDDAADFAEMQDQIARTLTFLDTIDPASLGEDDDRPVSFDLPNGMVFDLTAATYVRDWALPQFYFHVVAAYAVMRHLGVPLGKADYAGYMMQHLRPGTAPAA
ncbi:hypothetical protein AOA14_05695 [Sphingopyxis terrae subsp. terrae NBRC 15098]|uniref:DUF1993 domain-containing protein n=1 Tax=Sphingopyxis terrae subsp. terrae NBRC 15098 TaxID=1219058 RepID=A0A142VXS9_9SPHN|nr:DUF1993 domain-containing protein [Sphingopyxis terrae]AMU94097.1 hypothetical protein AOA14_05695 [Sphingopyxis terrae subsp. terrae NBRC 15098]